MRKDRYKKVKNIICLFTPRYIINRYNYIRDLIRIRRIVKRSIKPYVKGKYPFGVNLYGDFTAGTGLSRSVNLIKQDMKLSAVPLSICQVGEASGMPEEVEAGQMEYAVNVFHLQPAVVPCLLSKLPQQKLDMHYNIAHWAWETPDIPKEWTALCEVFDEFWVPSIFVARALRKVTDKPIRVFQHGVYQNEEREHDREEVRRKYGISPNAFVCLTLYDGRSCTERKNPEAAIRVFRKTFSDGPRDAVLVVKGKSFGEREKKRLYHLLGEGIKTVFIREELSYQDTEALMASVDVLISLHRAEGFGLPVAEAMMHGGVVLTTDYSATKEFANRSNACPVDYRLIKTRKDCGPYRCGTVWAEPDEEDAARKLRKLYEQPQYRERLGIEARKTIRQQLNAAQIGMRIRNRLAKICGELS